ncbi:uncharacterized protein LOC144359837 [Saccoglossus kowalevskii]
MKWTPTRTTPWIHVKLTMDSQRQEKWPCIVTFTLAALGYFRCNHGTTRRKCLPCLLKSRGGDRMESLFANEDGRDGETNNGPNINDAKSCKLCDGLNMQWRHKTAPTNPEISVQGDYEETTELNTLVENSDDIEFRSLYIQDLPSARSVTKKKSLIRYYLTPALCLLWLCGVTATIVDDWSYRLVISWGKAERILHLMSYSTYLLVLVVPIISRIISMFFESRLPGNWWVYVLTDYHVLTRLRLIDLSRVKKFGLLCILFPLTCVGFQAGYNIYEIVNKCTAIDIRKCIAFTACFAGEVMFASFCYIIHLLKRSLEADLNSTLLFLKTNIENVQSCRRRILETFADFLRLESLISTWLVFQFSVAIFKVSCQIYWNYWVFSENSTFLPAVLINVMIWLECFMFLLLPPLAVGGFSIDYLWKEFKLLSKMMYREEYFTQWDAIIKCLNQLKSTENSMYLTMFFSVLGVFSAIQLADQYADYWHEDTICT